MFQLFAPALLVSVSLVLRLKSPNIFACSNLKLPLTSLRNHTITITTRNHSSLTRTPKIMLSLANTPYSQTPLSFRSRVFRLVELQPSTEEEDIQCSPKVFSLDEEYPEYVALSYAWGLKQSTKHIVLEGKKCPVGDNLWWFLHHMQQQRRYTRYWIDAICIDQGNVLEQNHQVRLMQDIYGNAQSVSIWLGKAGDGSDIAISYLSRRQGGQDKRFNFDKFWTLKQAEGVLALCERNYWKRIWIVQEVMLARQATIYCGSKNICWSSFESLVEDLQRISSRGREKHTPCVSSILASPAIVIGMAKSAWNGELQPLTRLLQVYRDHEATNLRDKVYALLGLAHDRSSIPIDYRISTRDLLIQVLLHACDSERSIYDKETMTSRNLLRFGTMLADMLRVHFPEEEVKFYILEAERRASICHEPSTQFPTTTFASWRDGYITESLGGSGSGSFSDSMKASTLYWNEQFGMPGSGATIRRNHRPQ